MGKAPTISCHRRQLDKVDEIRELGRLDRISLPQIAVVGDQSGGKSALLEMISGVTFPKAAGMCTRFPTELSMRPAAEFSAKVFIDGKADSRIRLPKSKEDVARVIEDAKSFILEAEEGLDISSTVLTVELNGPQLPMLTLVDLPGYTQTHSQGQSKTTPHDIAQLAARYLAEPRTIILAVIPVNKDFETNVAVQHIRRFDEDGKRTLCVLTKPDMLDPGTEEQAIETLSGQKMHLVRGYHIIKNKNNQECLDGDSRELTLKKESIFFEKAPWSDICVTEKGIPSLIERLTAELSEQVEQEFSGIKRDSIKRKRELEDQLTRLGPEISTDLEKSNLLQRNIYNFVKQIKSLVDGHYSGGGFPEDCFIRARIQKLHENFHRQVIAITASVIDDLKVLEVMEATRGRELKGMFQQEAFVILASEVVEKWSAPTDQHIDEACKIASEISGKVIEKRCDQILVAYVSERMLEFFEHQNRSMHVDAHRMLNAESTPFTLQEMNFENLWSSVSGEIHGNPLSTSSKPDATGHQSHVNFRPTSSEPQISDTSKLKIFLHKYFSIAANRYVDAICLYVVERELFQDCDDRIIKWFADDPAALSRCREPRKTSNSRQKLSIDIKRLENAINILEQHTP
ncbi:hypothetical protein PSTT_13610 [Puccinia striiformis]|uniref:Dynamin-type G domain-containing protein n=1 Tax=Puccinia striiformis TaxID=27350 RepID=A0A2S4URA2_9BASI|nr:hypothetical protein PSTT_13610 [Puccinia striiformis]